MTFSRYALYAGAAFVAATLSGCGGSSTDSAAMEPVSAPVVVTPPSAGTTPPAATSPSYRTLASTALPTSTVAILTAVTGAGGSTSQISGVYDHPTGNTTGGGTTAATATARTYVGTLALSGGNNKVVAIPTLVSDMPTSGTATFRGTANVAAVDAANPANTINDPAMTATVLADFGAAKSVNVTLDRTAGGQIQVNNLLISGNSYANQASTVASATGMGAIPNYSAGTVKANGVFAGPAAAETGATMVIDAEAGIGQTVVTLTAGQ